MSRFNFNVPASTPPPIQTTNWTPSPAPPSAPSTVPHGHASINAGRGGITYSGGAGITHTGAGGSVTGSVATGGAVGGKNNHTISGGVRINL